MKKSEVRSSKSGTRQRGSRPAPQNSKSLPHRTPQEQPIFDFQISIAEPRTSDLGPRTLVIGYGNPLRSDDGFGWHAARMLAPVLAGLDAEVITCHQLTPELAEPLSRSSRAVFIDADAQGEPGEIRHCAVGPEVAAPSVFTHNCTPSGLLASAERLYGHRPKALLITVSAQSFAFGDILSPVVSAALPNVVKDVRQFVTGKELRPRQ